MKNRGRIGLIVAAALIIASAVSAAPVEPPESARMARAKDLILDERWEAAIAELRTALNDPKEPNKDEALYWLAHSQKMAGDLTEAWETVQRLQRDYERSRWKSPAGSLMIELAQKLGHREFLWWVAAPPPPPTPPGAAPPMPVKIPAPRSPRMAPPPPPAPAPRAVPLAPVPDPAAPPAVWAADWYGSAADLRIQALSLLIPTDAPKVIPLLRSIALNEAEGPARRALFVLAQSGNPEAQTCVVDVAKSGPEPMQIVAVKELARFGGSNISGELLDVYATARWPVKQQVVLSLGQRADKMALVRIAQSENDDRALETAILTLAKAGGSAELRVMYPKTARTRQAIIIRGLFNARDEDGLIRIAKEERNPVLRKQALDYLQQLGTPKAMEYLKSIK